MHIIFDLDGTISDSSPGVVQTFKRIFEIYNLPRLSDDEFRKYIGPPIEETLKKYLSPKDIKKATTLYRKLYKEEGGIYKNTMFEGIPELLQSLKRDNHILYLATTKEVGLAGETLEIFGIRNYFDGVYGADPKKNIYTKGDVLNELFIQHQTDKDNCILIGDTMYDVNGAKETGIRVGVVLYGFGKEEHFKGEKVEFFVDKVEELYDAIRKII